ncbi:hypothetical protein GCM10011533_32550 [Streptosporangium jomthongense]|nr:hypothetical protein GCM10011533_32550 [Streptosporangium jomthongense]
MAVISREALEASPDSNVRLCLSANYIPGPAATPQRTMPNSNPSVRQSGHITMMWRVWLTFWYYRVASHHYKVTGP